MTIQKPGKCETELKRISFILGFVKLTAHKKGQVWEGLQKLNLCHFIGTNHTPLHPNPNFKKMLDSPPWV